MYTQEDVYKAELDDACRRLKRALTPFAIARREREQEAKEVYIMLAWEGKRK